MRKTAQRKKKAVSKSAASSKGTLLSRQSEDQAAIEQLSEKERESFGLAGIGFNAGKKLSAVEEKRFHAFQENLLSLVSHELRTPLTGIINSLSVLEGQLTEPDGDGMPVDELVAMAKRNAMRLHDSLAQLLDLAALESSSLRVRLRETDLQRLIRFRLDAIEALYREKSLTFTVETPSGQQEPVLADAEKMGRTLDLCLQIISKNAFSPGQIRIAVENSCIHFYFDIDPRFSSVWLTAWSEAQVGFESRVISPVSAFSEALQTQEEFLTRTREGLHSELLIVMEILRRHNGNIRQQMKENHIQMTVSLPALDDNQGLQNAIQSRIYDASTGLSTVALALLQVPHEMSVKEFSRTLRKIVFRSSDGVYGLHAQRRVALMMDDCKPADAPRLLQRLEKQFGRALHYGVVICPDDGADPDLLIRLAEQRLQQKIGQLGQNKKIA